MRNGDPPGPTTPRRPGPAAAARVEPGLVVETVVSPFHCLYQDALEFHTQSHLRRARSEAEASRLARAAMLLYLASAESLVHQAAAELGHPALAKLLCDPSRPLPPLDAWRLLPAVVAEPHALPADPDLPPWPQFAELLALRSDWAYPGPESRRCAYYRRRPADPDAGPGRDEFEPLEPHQVPPGLDLPAERLVHPRTGLPRDPYALRPHHLDTARGVLDAAIDALDRLLGGALTRQGRHRREPVRVVFPPPSLPR